MKYTFIYSLILLGFVLYGCGDELTVPKPPTYLRTDFPQPKYRTLQIDCPYNFELNAIYSYKDVYQGQEKTCHKDIDLGPLNGSLHFSFIKMEQPLKSYIDYALSKVEEHQVKAKAIEDKQVIRSDARVFGTFFELKGDVASPFQFYLTDSTHFFASGVVYFNAAPNYDSLRPSLDYLKRDLMHLMETFHWK